MLKKFDNANPSVYSSPEINHIGRLLWLVQNTYG